MSTVGCYILTFFVLLTAIQSQTKTYCPSDDWIECGLGSKTCYIPPTVAAATVSYGIASTTTPPTANTGTWTFTSITNIAGKQLLIPCTGKNLGDPGVGNSGNGGGCCYNINNAGPSVNEDNWDFLATQQESILIKDQPALIRYGIAGQYSYRYVMGEILCSDDYFTNVYYNNASAIKNCYAYQFKNGSENNSTSIADLQFIPCGDELGSAICNEMVVPNGNSVVLMKYGQSNANWLYRYGFSESGDFPCTVGAFGAANANDDNFCYVVNNTMFGGATGAWRIVSSCEGTDCVIDEAIEYGVTSTSSTACSESWTESLSKTVSASLSFKMFGATRSLTTEQSTTVNNIVSNSYSKSTTLSCEAVCGDGSAADWTLYQWVINVGEYVKADIVPFDVNSCNYVCSTSPTAPQCPPGYCTPGTECTNCTGYP